jgi:Zn-finger nucleic acid-binding protein
MWPFGKKQGTETIDRQIRCPRCRVMMHKLTQRGVTIDVCPTCQGIWLDRGELSKLLETKHAIMARQGGKDASRKNLSRNRAARRKTAKHKKKT